MTATTAKSTPIPKKGTFLTDGTRLVLVLRPSESVIGVEVEDAMTEDVFTLSRTKLTKWRTVRKRRG